MNIDSKPGQHETSKHLPPHLCHLLLAIAEGWTPEPMKFSAVERLRYGDHDISTLSAQLSIQGDRLFATIGGDADAARLAELLPLSLDDELQGALVGGTTFHAEGFRSISSHGISELTLQAGSWTVLDGPEPALWIGRLENAIDIAYGGNLNVERIGPDGLRHGGARHFRFAGTYVYYLLQTGKRTAPVWQLLIDTGAGIPDRETLGREFLLLQFVLGRQLRTSEFLGISNDRHTVGSTAGAGTRENLLDHAVPPVPIARNNDAWVDESWTTLLFERVVMACNIRPELHRPFLMTFDSYLDAMTLHLDADYLRLQIALEGLAYWTLRLANEEERMVVKDKKAWKNWVQANSDAIRSYAADGFAESLYGKVLGVYRLSSGRVVPSAFLLCDTTLTEEMREELEARDLVVHQGMMTGGDYDANRELRRIAVVRAMLVALVAKTVDYRGALNGWEVGPAGYPVEPSSWWTVAERDRLEAERTFIADDSKPDLG